MNTNEDIFHLKGKKWELKQIKSQAAWAQGVYWCTFNIKLSHRLCNGKTGWTWDFPKDQCPVICFPVCHQHDGLKYIHKASEAGGYRAGTVPRYLTPNLNKIILSETSLFLASPRIITLGSGRLCDSSLQTGKWDWRALIRHIATKWYWHSVVLC